MIVRERLEQLALRRAPAGCRASTVWPSDSRRRAASSAAATHAGSVGAIPPGASVRSADAQPTGIGADLVAYGRAGGGAV